MTVANLNRTDDRRLLAEVSKWAHANGWTDGGWRGYMNARHQHEATAYVRLHECGFEVWRKERDRFPGRPMEYPATSIREAVDLLVALRILPDRFSSAFYAGVDACQPTMRRLVDGLVFGTRQDFVRLRQQVDSSAVSIRSGGEVPGVALDLDTQEMVDVDGKPTGYRLVVDERPDEVEETGFDHDPECPNCAPGYDCERGIYTPTQQVGE